MTCFFEPRIFIFFFFRDSLPLLFVSQRFRLWNFECLRGLNSGRSDHEASEPEGIHEGASPRDPLPAGALESPGGGGPGGDRLAGLAGLRAREGSEAASGESSARESSSEESIPGSK